MATLSATATWRAVLVSAEPAPARSRGSTSLTAEAAARTLNQVQRDEHPDRRGDAERGVPDEVDAHDEQPRRAHGLGAVLPDQAGAARRERQLPDRERHGQQAGVQRAVAADAGLL